MKRIAVFYLLWLCFSLKTHTQETDQGQSPINKLLHIVLNKTKENDTLKQRHLTYKEKYVFEEFNYKGELKKREESTTTLGGEARKLARFNIAIGELFQILVNRHRFSFANPQETIIDNRPALVMEFQPKDNLISNSNEDKFINRLRGTILIDTQNHSLLQVHGHIPESDSFDFKIWWFVFFATIDLRTFSLSFEQIEHNGITVENEIRAEAYFRVLGSTRTRKYHYQYSDYSYK